MATRNRGFTLVELLITLCIAWLLVQMTVPGLSELSRKSQSRSALQSTLGALDRARSSAVMMGRKAGVCMLADNRLCSDDWRGDYLAVFVDDNGNNLRDAHEDIIYQQAWPTKNLRLHWGKNWLNQRFIVYQPTGSVVSNGTLTLEDDKGNVLHSLVISKAGRARIESPKNP